MCETRADGSSPREISVEGSAKVLSWKQLCILIKYRRGKKNEDASFLRLWFSCRPAATGVHLFIRCLPESKISDPLPAIPKTSSLLADPFVRSRVQSRRNDPEKRRPEEHLDRSTSERLGLTSPPRLLCHHRLPRSAFWHDAITEINELLTHGSLPLSHIRAPVALAQFELARVASVPRGGSHRARFLGVPPARKFYEIKLELIDQFWFGVIGWRALFISFYFVRRKFRKSHARQPEDSKASRCTTVT